VTSEQPQMHEGQAVGMSGERAGDHLPKDGEESTAHSQFFCSLHSTLQMCPTSCQASSCTPRHPHPFCSSLWEVPQGVPAPPWDALLASGNWRRYPAPSCTPASSSWGLGLVSLLRAEHSTDLKNKTAASPSSQEPASVGAS
jgi:hypothetical protein